MQEYHMSWWVWVGIIAGIIIFGQGMYYAIDQLTRVIRQTRKDWESGKEGAEAYKIDVSDMNWIQKEAIHNMTGAVAAGILASFVISSYGWASWFIYFGPILSFLGGIVCNLCFMIERRDNKADGLLA